VIDARRFSTAEPLRAWRNAAGSFFSIEIELSSKTCSENKKTWWKLLPQIIQMTTEKNIKAETQKKSLAFIGEDQCHPWLKKTRAGETELEVFHHRDDIESIIHDSASLSLCLCSKCGCKFFH
jgi:hypothetical protein